MRAILQTRFILALVVLFCPLFPPATVFARPASLKDLQIGFAARAPISVGDRVIAPWLDADENQIIIGVNDDMAAYTEIIFPDLASAAGLDRFSMDNELISSNEAGEFWDSTLFACHEDVAWSFKLKNLTVKAPFADDSLTARFLDDNRLKAEIGLDDFSLSAEFRFYWPVIDSWYCNTFGIVYDISPQVTVQGLDSAMTVAFTSDADASRVTVSAVENFSVNLGAVAFKSSTLTAIANYALGWADLFGISGCSSLTTCAEKIIRNKLTDDTEMLNKIKSAINSQLDVAVKTAGEEESGDWRLDYAVALAGVETDDDDAGLRALWDVDVSFAGEDSACAEGLGKASYAVAQFIPVGGDVDVMVPFSLVANVFYAAGRKGLFCSDMTFSGGEFFNATHVSVFPEGALAVRGLEDGDSGAIAVTVPIGLTVAGETLIGTPVGGEGSGALVVTADLVHTCGQGLALSVADVALEDFTVSVAGDDGTVADQLAVAVMENQDAIVAELMQVLEDDVTLLPQFIPLSDIGEYYLSLKDSVGDAESLTAGFVLRRGENPHCDR